MDPNQFNQLLALLGDAGSQAYTAAYQWVIISNLLGIVFALIILGVLYALLKRSLAVMPNPVPPIEDPAHYHDDELQAYRTWRLIRLGTHAMAGMLALLPAFFVFDGIGRLLNAHYWTLRALADIIIRAP